MALSKQMQPICLMNADGGSFAGKSLGSGPIKHLASGIVPRQHLCHQKVVVS